MRLFAEARAGFFGIPTKKRGFFNSALFAGIQPDLDFSRRDGRYLNL